MAKVWLCREVAALRRAVGLSQRSLLPTAKRSSDYVRQTTCPIGNPGDELSTIRGYRRVVIEASETEALARRWKPGFYRAPVTPEEAFDGLGIPRK